MKKMICKECFRKIKKDHVSLTIVVDKEDASKECLENYADWLLQNGWLGFADKILINNKIFFDNEKDGNKYLKFIKTLYPLAVKQEGGNGLPP